MPSGKYAPSSQRHLDMVHRRFEHRPLAPAAIRFVAYQALCVPLARESSGDFRTWLVEGYGPTLDAAYASLKINVGLFYEADRIPFLNPES